MLQQFRNHLVGWFSKMLIGLISLAFALFGIQYYLVSSRADQSVATVNGDKISSADLTAAYNRNRNKLVNQYGADLRLTTDLQEQLRQQALNELVLREVIYQGASQAGFMSSPLSVQAVIEQMPAFQVDGKFSYERFQRLLYNLSYTNNSFYKDLSQTLTVSQLSDGITQTAFALPNEIDKAYEVAEQKRDFKYLLLPIEQFERDIKPSDAEIKAYYDAHSKDYQSEAQVSVEYVELTVDDIKSKQAVTDQEMQDFYQNNQAAFASPARWQVAKAIVPVAKDAKAAVVDEANARVKQLSEQLSKEEKLPSDVNKEWVVAAKDTTALVKLFATMKVGQVSEPQVNKEGFVVYKLLAMDAPKPQPLSAVATQVKEAVLKQKAEHEFTSRTDQLSELAFTHPDSLKPIAEALGLVIKTTGSFTRSGSQEGLGASPKFVSAAFSEEVMQSSNSSPIDLGNGHIVILRIKSQQPAALLPLASVNDKIVAILKRQQAQIAVQKIATSTVEALRAGKDTQALFSAHQLKWQERLLATRQAPGLTRELVQLAFRQPAPKDKIAQYDSAAMSNGDHAIVSVEKVYPADVKKMVAEQRDNIKNSLVANYGSLDFNLYVKGLREKAKVKLLNKNAANSASPNIADDF
jgi:peptidyl-prolyl cis-trans isomerase D